MYQGVVKIVVLVALGPEISEPIAQRLIRLRISASRRYLDLGTYLGCQSLADQPHLGRFRG